MATGQVKMETAVTNFIKIIICLALFLGGSNLILFVILYEWNWSQSVNCSDMSVYLKILIYKYTIVYTNYSDRKISLRFL